MPQNQLSLFKQKLFGKSIQPQTNETSAPTGESTVMQTLPAYNAFLHSSPYAASTIEKYYADITKLSVYLREKKLKDITIHDLQQWIEKLLSKQGSNLDRKTINRKVSAVIAYFNWVTELTGLKSNPAASLTNTKVRSPLPDYLYENEVKKLYLVASNDPRTYLLVLLLLETGIKSGELLSLTIADVDTSDQYSPELWIKHTGKERKKDRKLALPPQFMTVYGQYREQYPINDKLFPYSDRFIQQLFVELKKQTDITKQLTPQTLRHTHVVQAYKRGEDRNRIFERIGLAPDSRKEADEVYTKLSGRGI